MRKTLIKTWRGAGGPGGPCSDGSIKSEKALGKLLAKFAGKVLASTKPFAGSITTTDMFPDVGCE
jgi:hypothetical protein